MAAAPGDRAAARRAPAHRRDGGAGAGGVLSGGDADRAPLADALRGCLLGTAVGDAIGLPFEGLSARRVARLAPGPLRHRFFFGCGLGSDDTEHTAMVAQCLVECGGDPERFARRLASRLRWWLLGLPAGIGFATLRSILRSWVGFPPARSGVWSAGNGPAMRSAVIGVFANGDRERMRALVEASTRLTHSDPKALRGALIVAEAAALGAAGAVPTPAECAAAMAPHVGDDAELAALVERAAASAAAAEPARELCLALGLGKGVSGYIYHTLPVALQIWLRHPRDVEAAITEAVRCGGDTDTVAAIVGGMVGAATGEAGLPPAWLRGYRDWPRSAAWLRRLADAAADAAAGGRPAAPRVSLPGVLVRNALFMIWVLLHGFRRLLPPY